MFMQRLKSTYTREYIIAKEANNLEYHYKKWDAFMQVIEKWNWFSNRWMNRLYNFSCVYVFLLLFYFSLSQLLKWNVKNLH